MPDNPNSLFILSQLDESEKGDIITNEELEEIGVAYGSKAKYEKAMRDLAERLSATQMGRGNYVPVGNGKKGPKIKAGTSTVPVGNLPKVKRINIVGKAIMTAGDAAQLFSIFRDPRIEIFNVAYISKTGEVLAHAAWTCGLPGLTPAVESNTLNDGFLKIQRTMEQFGASHIWIAHNHPTGNPVPSNEDKKITEEYQKYFKKKFAGHIILDHKEYSLFQNNFLNDRSFETRAFREPVKRFVTEHRKRAAKITIPEDIARMFKRVLTTSEETVAHAVLDQNSRIVSWLYGGDNYPDELKKFMRVAGGAKVITLTNSDFLYDKYCFKANRSADTKYDVLLDVILINRKTGFFEKSHAKHGSYEGATWQYNEPKNMNYIVKNQISSDKELKPPLSQRDINIRGNTMSDVNENTINKWSKDNEITMELEKFPKDTWIYNKANNITWLSHTFNDKTAFFILKEDFGDYDQKRQGESVFISCYRDLHLMQNNPFNYSFIDTVPDINTAKKIIDDTINYFDQLRDTENIEIYIKERSQFGRDHPELNKNNKSNTTNYVFNENTISNLPKWSKDNELTYINGAEFNFKAIANPYFKVKAGLNRSLFALFPETKRLGMNVEIYGEVDVVKKLVENTINYFKRNQDIDLKQTNNQILMLEKLTESSYIKLRDLSHSQPTFGLDNNTKENTMSATFNGKSLDEAISDQNSSLMGQEKASAEQNAAEEKNLSPKELAFKNATWQRKVVADALKNGTLSCLPGADGFADTKPAFNLVQGTLYKGSNLLYLKAHQAQHGFPTAEYASQAQIDLAKKDNPRLFIIKGQKGVTLNYSEETEDGKYVDKHVVLFNKAQLNKPKLFENWATEKQIQKAAEYVVSMREIHGDAWNPSLKREKTPGAEIVCTSTEPAEYLGQYLAAVSLGGKFKASPEQGKEFAQKMVDSLYEKTAISKSIEKQGEYVTDPFKLEKISFAANKRCKEIMSEMRTGPKIAQEQNQEQKQEQNRGRGL